MFAVKGMPILAIVNLIRRGSDATRCCTAIATGVPWLESRGYRAFVVLNGAVRLLRLTPLLV